MERDLVIIAIACVVFCVAVGFAVNWFERAIQSLPPGVHKSNRDG
jgi:hypothetical protein